MPYQALQGDIRKLFDQTAQTEVREAGRDIADAAGHAMTEAARAATPRQTGELASRWEHLPAREDRVGAHPAWTSGARNAHWRAPIIEGGSDPHEIRPRRERALGTPEGPRARVQHPGHEGRHMLQQAGVETEAALPAIAQPRLDDMADRIERRAESS